MIGIGIRRLHRVFLSGKATIRFCVGVILGLSFSIAVILSTIGIMDGFDYSLRQGLKKSYGELVIHSVHGFFPLEGKILEMKKKFEVKAFSPAVQVEAFVVSKERSKGVLVTGVEPQNLKKVTGIDLTIPEGSVAIGIELAKYFDVTVGDELVIAFAHGNHNFEGLPRLERVKIAQIVQHGVYLKDIRLVYINLQTLQRSLDLDEMINTISLNIPEKFRGEDLDSSIKRFKFELEDYLELQYGVRPYWQDFAGLIEAVKVQKFVIALILQLIVIISVFNVFAFLIFLNEKKAKDIFLFKSLGMSQKMLVRAWLSLIAFIWGGSCIISIGFVQIFGVALGNLSILKLPGDIYHLGELSIVLDIGDYALVFLLAFLWIFAISLFALWRLKRKSILQGLRKEFA